MVHAWRRCMPTCPFVLRLVLVPLVCAATGCDGRGREADDSAELILAPGSSSSPIKADEPGLPLVRVSDPIEPGPTEELIQIITTGSQYEVVLGHPPKDIDFEREWAVLYAPGPDVALGATAAVSDVRLSATGRTLLVTTSLEAPEEGCAALQARPDQVLVKFPRPTERPLHARQYRDDRVRHCSGPCVSVSCGRGQRCEAQLSVRQQQASAACVPVPRGATGCEGHFCVRFEACAMEAAIPVCRPLGPAPACDQSQCAEGSRCVGGGIHATCVALDGCHRDEECAAGQLCGPAFRCLHSNCAAPLTCQPL